MRHTCTLSRSSLNCSACNNGEPPDQLPPIFKYCPECEAKPGAAILCANCSVRQTNYVRDYNLALMQGPFCALCKRKKGSTEQLSHLGQFCYYDPKNPDWEEELDCFKAAYQYERGRADQLQGELGRITKR